MQPSGAEPAPLVKAPCRVNTVSGSMLPETVPLLCSRPCFRRSSAGTRFPAGAPGAKTNPGTSIFYLKFIGKVL